MEAKEKKPGTELVKVKILKFVGQHSPGEIIEVPASTAAHLCKKTPVNVGEGKLDYHQKAILLSDALEMEHRPVDIRKMSCKELADLGKKNIVPTPIDHAFEARLKQLRAGKNVKVSAKLSEEAMEGEEYNPPEWVPGAKNEKAEEAEGDAETESAAAEEVESGEETSPEADDSADDKESEAPAKKAKNSKKVKKDK